MVGRLGRAPDVQPAGCLAGQFGHSGYPGRRHEKALRDYLFQQLDHTDDVALIRMATMYLDVQIGREAVPFCVTFEEAA